jgi:glutamate synthase (NADPH/NADH) large chain
MQPNAAITPSTLSVKDLPWQILWHKDKCTLCGRCTAVCPVNAIELGVFRKRRIRFPWSPRATRPAVSRSTTAFARKPIRPMPAWAAPPAVWSAPMMPSFPCTRTKADKLRYHINRGGQPRSRGGRRNAPGGILDQIKFIRISMLTDPALDAGRHEFEMRTLLGRVLPPEQNLKFMNRKTGGFHRFGRFIR